MGKEIKRIEQEFIYKYLKDHKVELYIQLYKHQITGCLSDFSDKQLTINTTSEAETFLKKRDEIKLFFNFHGAKHIFKARIIKINHAQLILTPPSLVLKDLQRKYERIHSGEEITISFMLKEKKVTLNFPVIDVNSPLRDLVIPQEVSNQNMTELIKEFKISLQGTVETNQIIMMRNKVPSTYEEILMSKTGKILWIPDVQKGLQDQRLYPTDLLTTYRDIQEAEENLSAEQALVKFKMALQTKKDRASYSQLYCPIFYNYYFIGYVYLSNGISLKKIIDYKMVKHTYDFTKILCYSLESNHYFETTQKETNFHDLPIIDISASGLLFGHTSATLPQELLLHKTLDFTITIHNRPIALSARVMRKFRDSNYNYFGIEFNNITPEDFRFLYEYIYGNSYTPEIKTVWEGTTPFTDVTL